MANILSVALGELGYKEGSNNNTKYGAWYGANYQAWCAMFVSWCANQSGILGTKVPKFAACVSGRDWYKKNNKFSYSKAHGGNYTPNPCDIIFFNWNKSKTSTSQNHVGIVEKVDSAKVYTVEGNTGDMVKRRSYSLNDANIIGYGKTFLTYSANETESKNTYTTTAAAEKKVEPEPTFEHEKTIVNRSTDLFDYQSESLYPYELLIENKGKLYPPLVSGEIVLSLERKDIPGKLTFSLIADSVIEFTEGSAVRFKYKGLNMFYGWVFTKKRNKENVIDVTCYDQIRYLKNKDVYNFVKMTAAQIIRKIASDFNMQAGVIEDTKHVIASQPENNTTLLDMIQTALGDTLLNKGEMYVLYDDFGKLTLKNIASMKIPLLIDSETGENYDYTSTIDENTYNKIKLSYSEEEGGNYDIYIAKDSSKINEWGVLQYYDTLKEGENGQAKADALLKLYNTKTRNLKINKALGDGRVRGGSMLVVKLDLGDMGLQNWMLVERCVHTFSESEHFMDLTLRGGEFIG